MSPERRVFARIRLDVPASLFLYQLDFQHAGAIVDLSLGGCYFPVPHTLPCGERCSVQLTTGEGLEVLTVELAGVIVRTDEKGVGIQFTDLTDDARQLLVRILDRKEAEQNNA